MTEREMQIYHWCTWDYIGFKMERGYENIHTMKNDFIRITETTDSVESDCYMCKYYKRCAYCPLSTKGRGSCSVEGSLYNLLLFRKDPLIALEIRDIFGNASGQRNTLYNFVIMDTLRRGILNGTITNTLDYIQKKIELNNFLEDVYDYLLIETPEATDRFVQSYMTAGDMIETDPQKAAEIIETAYANVTLL